MFLKFSSAPSTFNKQKRGHLRKRDGNCHGLADSRWEMLLKAVGQLLGTVKWYLSAVGNAQRLLESLWAIM